MKEPASKPMRCALLTRKSTDDQLDLAFNCRGAQREAWEAFIKSFEVESMATHPFPMGSDTMLFRPRDP